jgi:rubredoxin
VKGIKKVYQCQRCGYHGDNLIFQATHYCFVVATNDGDNPEYISDKPDWLNAEQPLIIERPFACPNCKNFGEDLFEIVYLEEGRNP